MLFRRSVRPLPQNVETRNISCELQLLQESRQNKTPFVPLQPFVRRVVQEPLVTFVQESAIKPLTMPFNLTLKEPDQFLNIYLFTSTFKSVSPKRQQELDFCFNSNINNKFFTKCFVFSEDTVHKNVIKTESRPTFNTFLEHMRLVMGPNDYGIIANSDIIFDSTLQTIQYLSTSKNVLCLSRWDLNNNILKLFDQPKSQDTWVFKGPPHKDINANFYLGILGCDNKFAFLLKSKYALKNYCRDIVTMHIHECNVRTYKESTRLPQPYEFVDTEPKSCYTLKDWQTTKKDHNMLILQASSTDHNDAWHNVPIGMCVQWGYVAHLQIQIGSHENLVMCSITPTTDMRRRPFGKNRQSILKTLSLNGIQNDILQYTDYFTQLPMHKFVISPEGNGIDCHRHYEALIAGCIPIIEKNDLTESKYIGLPILWTSDYSEITNEYLEQKYNEMLLQTYNFSSLFINNYNKREVLVKSRFWLNHLKVMHLEPYRQYFKCHS